SPSTPWLNSPSMNERTLRYFPKRPTFTNFGEVRAMPGRAAKVIITERQQEVLQILTRSSTCPQALVQRAHMLVHRVLRRGNVTWVADLPRGSWPSAPIAIGRWPSRSDGRSRGGRSMCKLGNLGVIVRSVVVVLGADHAEPPA